MIGDRVAQPPVLAQMSYSIIIAQSKVSLITFMPEPSCSLVANSVGLQLPTHWLYWTYIVIG